MATVGKNIKVDAYKIFSKIIDEYKHVFCFCEKHGISYATLSQLFAGKTKSLRAETVVKIAGALGCSAKEIIKEDFSKKDVEVSKSLLQLKNLIKEISQGEGHDEEEKMHM